MGWRAACFLRLRQQPPQQQPPTATPAMSSAPPATPKRVDEAQGNVHLPTGYVGGVVGASVGEFCARKRASAAWAAVVGVLVMVTVGACVASRASPVLAASVSVSIAATVSSRSV
jgi:predicted lipid-binding transport protein (Tim44 family)